MSKKKEKTCLVTFKTSGTSCVKVKAKDKEEAFVKYHVGDWFGDDEFIDVESAGVVAIEQVIG